MIHDIYTTHKTPPVPCCPHEHRLTPEEQLQYEEGDGLEDEVIENWAEADGVAPMARTQACLCLGGWLDPADEGWATAHALGRDFPPPFHATQKLGHPQPGVPVQVSWWDF